jgi:hypothetical protein
MEMPKASSSKDCSNKFFSLKKTWARSFGGVLRHEGNAALAAATASFTSVAPDAGTEAMSSPLEGLKAWSEELWAGEVQ